MDFKRFENINFDKILQDTDIGTDTYIKTLDSNVYIEYTQAKLDYLLKTGINHEEFKKITSKMKDFKTIDNNGDVLYSYTNYQRDNKLLKDLIVKQQNMLDNFLDFTRKIRVIDSKLKSLQN